jgi:ribonuclease P protein component
MGKFTFRPDEKLKREKHIQELFDKGSSFYLFPFKVIYLPNPEGNYPVHQLLISVSKKKFKRAVDRNLIKRRIREAYRLQKHAIPRSPKLLIGYIYTHNEILLFDEIKKRMSLTFNKLSGAPLAK